MLEISQDQKMMRQSCRDFVDDVVMPFVRGNWQREWNMTPAGPAAAGDPRRRGPHRYPHAWRAREFGGIDLDPGTEVSTFALISEEIARGDSGLADKLVQNWKVALLLRNVAPKHLQEKWFARLTEDPQFLLAHCLTEPRGASDRWLPYNVPEAAMQTRAVNRRRGGSSTGASNSFQMATTPDFMLSMPTPIRKSGCCKAPPHFSCRAKRRG